MFKKHAFFAAIELIASGNDQISNDFFYHIPFGQAEHKGQE
jgi:hypothetical protein